ncbi:MAG: SDR family oxidoreductase [Alphaproteobacteria bacterium]|nr:SDR family oxidoreductase [Alphaproteobacteria bacterium]
MELNMSNTTRTVIVTGGSQGIGAGAAKAFLDRGYNVIATSRNVTKSEDLASSPKLAVVDGEIGDAATAARAVRTAINTFGSIDALVNNAGIFLPKPFTEYTTNDLGRLVSTNLAGLIYMTQHAIRQMLAQKSGGSIVNITAALADNPIAGVNASIPMMTKGGIQAITRSLAIEYAKDAIRVNAVAPGVVDTPMHRDSPKDFLRALSPMSVISTVREIADAVIYLTEAPHVTGEVLHVDGGAHVGKW